MKVDWVGNICTKLRDHSQWSHLSHGADSIFLLQTPISSKAKEEVTPAAPTPAMSSPLHIRSQGEASSASW